MYPYNSNQDDNIGGGRGNIPDKPIERMAINIATDRRLTTLERNKKIIDQCLDKCGEDTNKLVDMVYFNKSHTLEGAAMNTLVSYSKAKQLRLNLFELIADELRI